MLAIPVKKTYPSLSVFVALAAIYLCVIIKLIPAYFVWDGNLCLGFLLAPYICTIRQGQLSSRYLLPALIATAFAVICPVNTLLFIATLFAALLFVENSQGKVSPVLLFLILLISPVFHHLTHLVEFPVRLWLSDMVAQLLQLTGINASAAGNQIQLSSCEFSVDPACAGLNMLVTSLLVCLFAVSVHQKKFGRQLSWLSLSGIFALTIALNVVSNFFRILALVYFKIMPGTLFHNLTGIGCFSIYVMLPLMLGAGPYVKYWGKCKHPDTSTTLVRPNHISYTWSHILLLTAIVFVSAHVVKADNLTHASANIKLAGYKKTPLAGGITKLENKDALIYIKPTAFYAPEHDPTVCWAGSGYQFKNIRGQIIKGTTIYTATLQKGTDKIYAAWWFDNGTIKTTNQLTWRWKAARGEAKFYLVNVNAATPQTLQQQVTKLLTQARLF